MLVKLKDLTATAFLSVALLVCHQAAAASGGIRNNRLNECAIWLCLPGGFATGCGDAYSAFVGRLTDVTKHGVRRYTDLPDFPVCVDQDPTNTAANSGSVMTYDSVPYAYIPEHQECARWSADGDHCRSWVTVPERKVKGVRCRFNSGGSDRYGTSSTPAYCTQTFYMITVYGDGVKYGQSFEWYGRY